MWQTLVDHVCHMRVRRLAWPSGEGGLLLTLDYRPRGIQEAYLRNLQGDVIALIAANGNKVVNYAYDPLF